MALQPFALQDIAPSAGKLFEADIDGNQIEVRAIDDGASFKMYYINCDKNESTLINLYYEQNVNSSQRIVPLIPFMLAGGAVSAIMANQQRKDFEKQVESLNEIGRIFVQITEMHSRFTTELGRLINAKCNDGTYRLSDDLLRFYKQRMMDFVNEAGLMRSDFIRYEKICYSRISFTYGVNIAASICTSAIGLLKPVGFMGGLGEAVKYLVKDVTSWKTAGGIVLAGVSGSLIDNFITDFATSPIGQVISSQIPAFQKWALAENIRISRLYNNLIQNIINSYKDCKKIEDNDDNGNNGYGNNGNNGNDNYPTPPVTPSIDPSGYVYEGVPSNRLQGVTATVYFLQQTEDMYGDVTEEPVVWDATEFGQRNPLSTDEQGMYAWDVPQGMWQVKFEKEGYETTYSEWLPVPPPQLDVNIAMTQLKQPEVSNLHAYTDGITIEFDKFMLPATLTAENIKISQNGQDISGKVTFLNAESDGKGNTYCSKMEFVPSTELAEGEATVFVSRSVKSYAEMQMNEDFRQTVKVEARVKEIAGEDVSVFSGSTVTVEATILPLSAAAGKKVAVEEMNPYIAKVDQGSVYVNGNGRITFEAKGLIPGKAVMRISLEGYDIYKDITINVLEMNKVAAPIASLASGSVVTKGTEILLSCSTEGATIYYTTDGSCPCDPATAKVYDGTPIVITATTTLKVVAMKKDMDDSRIVEFEYIVKEENAVEEVLVKDELHVYPLPMRDVINVSAGGKVITRLSIMAMNGSVVRRDDECGQEVQVNVQSLAPGIYILNVTTADGTLHRKVVKVN